VVYEIGKITVPSPNWGPLAVFDTEQEAREFKDSIDFYNTFRIFKCEYTKSKHKRLWVGYLPSRGKDSNFPPGTRFADSVTLLEEVK
jgi:hypothetical protein